MSDKMTTKETSAWLIGQHTLLTAIIETLEKGHNLNDVLQDCATQIMEESRKNGQMALMFITIENKSRLAKLSK